MAEATVQSRVVEELDPQRLADHQRARSAEQVGDDELADRRDEDQEAAGQDAGHREPAVTFQKAPMRVQPRSRAASTSDSSIFSSVE
jgi:hypothetical protein